MKTCPFLTVALALLALLAMAPAVQGHANLLSVDPPIDQTHHLDGSPTRFLLNFSEEIDASNAAAKLFNTTSMKAVDTQAAVDQASLTLAFTQPLAPGTYVLQYNVVSTVDGHPTRETIGFAIGAFAPPPSHLEQVNPTPLSLSKAIMYSGLAIAFAAVAFLLWMPGYEPATARRALLLGATLHFVGLIWLFRTAYLDSQAASLAAYVGSRDGAGPVYLSRAILGGGAWLLASLGNLKPTRTAPFAIAALLLAAAAGSSRLGHASGLGIPTIATDLAHLLAASIWSGGLLLFALLLRRGRADDPDEIQARGIRFGTIALIAVAVLASTGLVLSVSILGADRILPPTTLLSSAYGQFLIGKIAIAVLMVGAAGINRYVLLHPAANHGVAGFAQRSMRIVTRGRLRPGLADGSNLRRSVAIEASLGIAILVLAGFLTSVPTPIH